METALDPEATEDGSRRGVRFQSKHKHKDVTGNSSVRTTECKTRQKLMTVNNNHSCNVTTQRHRTLQSMRKKRGGGIS